MNHITSHFNNMFVNNKPPMKRMFLQVLVGMYASLCTNNLYTICMAAIVTMATNNVSMVTMAAMQIVYKLFVQSDAHIHHHCQETYNNISITSV